MTAQGAILSPCRRLTGTVTNFCWACLVLSGLDYVSILSIFWRIAFCLTLHRGLFKQVDPVEARLPNAEHGGLR